MCGDLPQVTFQDSRIKFNKYDGSHSEVVADYLMGIPFKLKEDILPVLVFAQTADDIIIIYIRFQKIPIHLESFEHIHIYILTQMHFSQIQVVPEKSLYENLNKQL